MSAPQPVPTGSEAIIDFYDQQAHAALLLPMAPQLLTEEERLQTAMTWVGWEFLANSLTHYMKEWTDAFGGDIIDAAMKAKVQAWLQGWAKGPTSYALHTPAVANGQWIRIFRTTMNTARKAEAFRKAVDTLPEAEVVAEYEALLGVGSRDRYNGYKAWCQSVLRYLATTNPALLMEFENDIKTLGEYDILAKYKESALPFVKRESHTGFLEWVQNSLDVLRTGDWHIAVYHPAWEAFVSPFGTNDENYLATMGSSINRYRQEFPHIPVQLYPSRPNVGFNLALAVFEGAFVEFMGDRNDVPPFGSAWGDGVILDRFGGSKDRKITGIIHKHPLGVQTFKIKEDPQGYIQMDPPNPFSLLQDIYWATGFMPLRNLKPEFMQFKNIVGFADEFRNVLANEEEPKALVIPKQHFLDAVLTNPNFVPVYGRIISISPVLRQR